MQERRCIIFCAGEEGELPFEITEQDFIICCDAGFEAAERKGVLPDLILGDFDSCHGKPPKGVEIMRYPVEKDDTDSMLALREGLRRGYRSFVLLFSLGGRLDHTIANLQTLAFLEENDAQGILIGPRDTVRLLKNSEVEIHKREGYTLSIFAFRGTAYGVTLTGMQYPLQNATVTEAFPIGLGNHIVNPIGKISVSNGTLLVVESLIN